MDASEFTVEELIALTAGLGLPVPAFLAAGPTTAWPPEVRREVEAIGRRSLAARGVTQRAEDDQDLIPEGIALLCDVISRPELFIRISSVATEGIRTVSYLSAGPWCAGVRPTPHGNFSFTVFESSRTRDALDEILDLPIADGDETDDVFEVPASDIQRLLAVERPTDIDDVDELLRRSEVDAAIADRLRPLMTDRSIGWSVEVLVPGQDGHSISGSVTTWCDTPAGRWLATTTSGDEAAVVYRRCGAATIRALIDEGWPDSGGGA